MEINPDDSTLVRDLGVTLLHAGRAAAADSVLSSVSAANPRDWDALYHLGIAREMRGDAPGAVAAYRAFLALVPARLELAITDAHRRLDSLQTAGPRP